MTEDRATALLERPAGTPLPAAPAPRQPESQGAAPAGQPARVPDAPDGTSHGPRRWNDPDEKLMLWGVLAFLALGVYAGVFVALAMWLAP